MLEREMAKHQDQVVAEPSYAGGGACPSWEWPILPLGAGPLWIRAGPLHLPGGERPILTGTSILSQTWNPPPSSSFPPHLSLFFPWLQPLSASSGLLSHPHVALHAHLLTLAGHKEWCAGLGCGGG